MKSVKTIAAILSSAIALGLLGAGCGSGYSTQESNVACKNDLAARGTPNDQEAFQACVVCFEQCTDCAVSFVDGKLEYMCPTTE